MSADSDKLAAAMEEVLALISTPRTVGRTHYNDLEPRHLTDAYAQLIVANGFAALGDHRRARALRDAGLEVFVGVADDPVHAYLTAAFSARIDQSCAGMPRDSALPAQLHEQYRALDRIGCYRVDRLRECSRILAPGEPGIDAIVRFSRRERTAPDDAEIPWLVHLRSIRAPSTRAAEIDRMLVETNLADSHLTTCFDALLELSEQDALPVLAPAIHRLISAKRTPVATCAHALLVAARFGYGELAPDLLRILLRTRDELAPVLSPTLRALRRLGLWSEMSDVLALFEPVPSDAPVVLELLVAAARTLIHDDVNTRPFHSVRKTLGDATLTVRIETIRLIAGAASHGDVDFAIEQVLALDDQYGTVVDSFGTNIAYNLTILNFVESLVLALVDLALSLLNPRAAADAPMLAWKYAL